jgi:hypothetical protein
MGHFFPRYRNLIYRGFEGDILSAIVLGEIAHHNITKLYSFNCIEILKPLENCKKGQTKFAPCKAHSMRETTDIPRETRLVNVSRAEVTISKTVGEHFMQDFNKKLVAEILDTSECVRKHL